LRYSISVTALLVNAASFASPAHADPADSAQLQTLEQKLAAAVEARDTDAIMRAYIADESLFVFDVIPPRQYVGAKAFRKDWEDFLAGTKGSLTYEITDLAVVPVGSVAYGHSIQRIVTTGTKGDPVDLTTRVTDVYRKIDGRWVIVQEHISIPVDLNTGKPDLASRP
jgi:ketosteroid isomerase-like protein